MENDPSMASGGTLAVGNFTLQARAFVPGLEPSTVTEAQFNRSGDACTYSLSASFRTVQASAGGGVIAISASDPACAWTASSNVSWLTPHVASGTGSQSLAYHLQANASPATRVGAITVGQQYFVVSQAGQATCEISVDPASLAAPAAGLSGELSVTATNPACVWSATSDASWLTLAATTSPSPYAQAVVEDEPSGYWRLDESTGATVAADLSGHDRDGAYAGDLTLAEAGSLADGNTAARFNDATAAVTIAGVPTADAIGLTWEAWVNLPQTSASARFVLGKGMTTESFALWVQANDNRPTFAWTAQGSSRQEFTPTNEVVAAGWTHLAFSYDGQTWRAFVNGAQTQSGSVSTALATSTDAFTLAGGAALDGWLDDVAVYDYAVSAAQIANHYASRTGAGAGTAVVPFTITAHTETEVRTATVDIGGLSIPVAQAGTGDLAVVATVTPAPNAAGWHTSDVTVNFACAGTGTIVCPEPVVVTTDGVHEISREATNDLEQTGTATVTVRRDTVAPFIAAASPVTGAVVAAGPVAVQGTVVDLWSTPTVTCNGAAAAIDGDTFSCTVSVSAASPAITLVAHDVAGNESTSTITLVMSDDPTAPTSLRVTPSVVKMKAGETRRFAVVDNLGRIPNDAVWSVDNSNILTLATSAVGTITAVTAGEAVVTATWRGVSASATVTVVGSAAEYPSGTVLWSAPPLGATVETVLTGGPTLDGRRQIYSIERTGNSDVVRALDEDGRELWARAAGGIVRQLSGEPLGGAAILVELDSGAAHIAGLREVKVFRANGEPGPILSVYQFANGFAIHPDGMLYAVRNGQLVGEDIGYGAGHVFELSTMGNGRNGIPTVLEDGTVALPFVFVEFGVAEHLKLLYLRRDGTSDVRDVKSSDSDFFNDFRPFKAIPNGLGGVIVAWDASTHTFNGNYAQCAAMASLDADGNVLNHSCVGGFVYGWQYDIHWGAAHGLASGALVLGEQRVAFSVLADQVGGANPHREIIMGWVTQDVGGGMIQTLPNYSRPPVMLATTNDEFVYSYSDGLMGGPGGQSGEYEPMSLAYANDLGRGRWAGRGLNDAPSGMAGPTRAIGESVWAAAQGGTPLANAAINPKSGIFAKAHGIGSGAVRHVSIRMVPANQVFWRQHPNPDDSIFKYRDWRTGEKLYFGTLGAGPAFPPCFSPLTSAPNRPNDVSVEALEYELLPVARILEDALIGRLLYRDENYDDDVDYDCVPDSFSDGYNSNSYAHGLLLASDLPEPTFMKDEAANQWELYPGWTKPLPQIKFEP